MPDASRSPIQSARVPYFRQHRRKRRGPCDSVSSPGGDMSTAQLSSQIVYLALFVHGGTLCTVHRKAHGLVHTVAQTCWCVRAPLSLLHRIPVRVEISTAAPLVPFPPSDSLSYSHPCPRLHLHLIHTSTSDLHHTQPYLQA